MWDLLDFEIKGMSNEQIIWCDIKIILCECDVRLFFFEIVCRFLLFFVMMKSCLQ